MGGVGIFDRVVFWVAALTPLETLIVSMLITGIMFSLFILSSKGR